MFEKDGIILIENFLPPEILGKLNDELDVIFSNYSVNGSLSSTQLTGWTENRRYLECTVPGLILSVNVFEIIVDVAEQFKRNFDRFSSEDYVLTVFHIYSEQGNSAPLYWHTDNRDGMVRGIIFLKGGGDDSGKFMFMKGTHDRDYYVEHKLSEEKFNELQDIKIECTVPEGSLVMFDSKGFHARKKVQGERRVMFLEFHPRNNQYCKERVLVPSNHITKKVISNIDLFANTDFNAEDLGVHGHEIALCCPKPLPLKISLAELKKSLVHTFLNSLKRIWDSLKRLVRKEKSGFYSGH